MGTVTISETLDAGEKLVITITGNPNSVRIGTNPGNALVSAQAGNLNLTITLTAGITGITISGGASAGANTVITLRCTPVATSTTTTPTSTGPTPNETSDAIDSANTSVNTVRQTTTPNNLPTVSQQIKKLRESGADEAYIKKLDDDAQAARDVEYDQLDSQIENLNDQISSNYSQVKALVDSVDPDYSGDRNYGLRYSEPLEDNPTPGTSYHDKDNSPEFAQLLVKLEAAGRLGEYQALAEKKHDLHDQRNGAYVRQDNIRDENDARSQRQALPDKHYVPGPRVWFTGEQGSDFIFNVDMSTDVLRQMVQANLDEAGAPETVLPPLTIAGMPVNIWVRGRGTIFDAQNRFGNDGWAGHVLSGIALQTNEKITIGAFGSYLTSSTETKFNNSEIDSTSAGGGAYINMKLVDTISAGLSINREVGEQDIKIGTTTGTADTGLTAVGASLQGSWFVDPVFVSPSLSVSYSDYIREKYTDSTGTVIPSSRSRDTTIAAAATASRTYSFEEGGWFTSASPRVSATVNYFARENRSLRVSTTQIIDLTDWSGNVGTGVTLATEGNSTISIDLGVIGIGQDTLGYTGQLQVDFGF
ncbi:autotransporter outer membrane beta-barrel domain-containing protein [Pyruvatibacter sp.]|uniref:autotransporter outer membrane beta-barrel domain-containing protein n=1 Tax=Pyruvatibacter sp. TaxID=1981328 RepID=UPI003266E5B9